MIAGMAKERGKRQRGRGTKTERRRGNERILIRNLKNKIIRLPDSKCQLREGSRWREKARVRERHKEIQEEGKTEERKTGEKKHSEGDRWGWTDGDTSPSLLPPGGRNTIFLMLRSNTSPGKIFPISHCRETEPPGQAGESSYEGVYVCVNLCACTLPH